MINSGTIRVGALLYTTGIDGQVQLPHLLRKGLLPKPKDEILCSLRSGCHLGILHRAFLPVDLDLRSSAKGLQPAITRALHASK